MSKASPFPSVHSPKCDHLRIILCTCNLPVEFNHFRVNGVSLQLDLSFHIILGFSMKLLFPNNAQSSLIYFSYFCKINKVLLS